MLPLLALALASPAQSSWSTADGLPASAVNDVLVDRDGYVWVATFDGLARFDGARFTVFDADATPGLPTNRVVSLDQDPRGALWLGLETGALARRDPTSGAAIEPKVDQLVRLDDPSWPAGLRLLLIVGRVTAVEASPDQPLRRLITVRPLTDLDRMGEVLVWATGEEGAP